MRNAPLLIVFSLLGAAYALIYVINAPRLARAETQSRFKSLTQRHDDFSANERKLILNGVSFSDDTESQPFNYDPPDNPPMSLEERTALLTDIKTRLEGLPKDRLGACQNYEIYDRVVKLNQSLPGGRQHITGSPSTQTFLAQAARYTGEKLTIDQVTELAKTEIRHLQTEYDRLEARIIKAEHAPDLETYAALPIHKRKNAARIKSEYETLLVELTGLFEPYLYDYGAPQAGVQIKQFPHRWHAVASYQKNTMTLYFNTPTYDAKDYAFLAVHEIMPGHHLDFWAGRKPKICAPYKSYKSRQFQEGWATYAETLADEAGFFDAPDRRLGWLDYRMIRAVRILLDIEISTNGDDYEALEALWESRMPPRSHALFDREYKRLKRSKHHHLGYILGAQAITDARKKLEMKMGEDFDIKDFHDAFLRGNYPDSSHFHDQLEAAMLSLTEDVKIAAH